ncbi:hypothetical protein ANN_03405 [Periplaneta americana]|uniref:Uncharacterized protein n=1 Tax=Periplaneta americana TaxID=6978 RepID=A0ABQ8U328_PERAM|nr:hypothetical protein ANN_03405 [Periplaneta americana]
MINFYNSASSKPTNGVIPSLKLAETKTRPWLPIPNTMTLSSTQQDLWKADLQIFTDGSKTDHHQLLTNHYRRIWNSTYINSEQGLYTKTFMPNIPHRLSLSLGPSYITTQFLTNHCRFRSYLYKMNKCPSPLCNCLEKPPQTALHLTTECSQFAGSRPKALWATPLHMVLKLHFNTIEIAAFLKHIFHTLQE